MRSRVLLLSGLALAGAIAAWGCNAVLGLGDYQVRADGGINPANCNVDLTTQCYPCAPTNDPQFLNSCTGAACVSFDPKRVTGLLPDGGLPAYPKLTPPDAGPVDAGSDGGSVDGGATDGGASDAAAPATCANVKTGTPVVYVTGTAKPYVQALATALFNDAKPILLVYKGQSSCVAWDAALNGTLLTGPASYWPGTTTETTCTIPAGGVVADVSISDIFASSCTALPNGLPKDVGDFFGPAQAMTFIVPKASPERSISAQAAYFVYGFGAQSGVAPWTDPAYIYRLDDTSGTQRIIGAGIGVPASEWKGTNLNFSSKLSAALTTAPPQAIGILSVVNITDALRQQIHVLAYRHYGQTCAVYPDSTDTNRDKSNVRDGHYNLWGPLHLSSRLDANGFVKSADAKRVVNYFTGITPPPSGLDLIETEALNNLVPQCAMKVTRSTEMGPLSPFKPQNACGCYFEQKATGQTSCTKCAISSECPASAPACSFGYCEAQ